MNQKIAEINKQLTRFFGVSKLSKILPDPVDMLIGTILSQNTNDQNSYKAFQNLKNNFGSWDQLAKLPTSRIEKFIKVAGLSKQKSKAIKGVLVGLLKKRGKSL